MNKTNAESFVDSLPVSKYASELRAITIRAIKEDFNILHDHWLTPCAYREGYTPVELRFLDSTGHYCRAQYIVDELTFTDKFYRQQLTSADKADLLAYLENPY